MSIARQAFVLGSNSSNTVATVTVTGVSAGDTIVIGQTWDGSSVNSASVTCPGETVDAVGTESLWTNYPQKLRWHVIANVQSGGDKTITSTLASAPQAGQRLFAWRISGALTSSPVDDQQLINSGSSGSVSLTTSQSGSAIFAWSTNNNGAPTGGANYTLETGVGWDGHEYDLDAGSAGSKTVDFVRGGATSWSVSAIAIKSADGVGGGAALMGQACL